MTFLKLISAGAIAMLASTTQSFAQERTPAPEGASVSFYAPVNGMKINAPFVSVMMNATGVEIAPAGTERPNTGHHHLLINTELKDPNSPIPADENHIHFGAGQTSVNIDLKPGRYTLQLVLADSNHVPHDPVIQSEPVEIEILHPTTVGPAGARYILPRYTPVFERKFKRDE